MAVTLESLDADVKTALRGIDEIKDSLEKQNGRQRKNTETIILLCAKMDGAEDKIDIHEKAIVKNANDIHDAQVSSAKGDKVIGILTALIGGGGVAAYLVFGR